MQRKRLAVITALAAIALLAVPATHQQTARADDDRSLEAVPFTFVGTAPGCAPSPPGSRIVTSAWLNGFGLPDDGTSMNTAAPNDPHSGLLLSKDGPTTDCSEAGATITGFKKLTLTATDLAAFELGFDYRFGTHCGAGAPRFNVNTSDATTHFFGCADGTSAVAPQDSHWRRVRFTAAQGFTPLTAGETITSISIAFDEGTDTANPPSEGPNGVGLVNLDNIDINGHLITSGPSKGRTDDTDTDHGDGHSSDGDHSH